VAVAQGLSYCNYCGAKLNGVPGDDVINSSEVKAEMLVAAMVFVFVLGLGAITLLLGVMKAVLHLEVGLILAFTSLCFLMMLSIEGVLVRLLFRRRQGAGETVDRELLKEPARGELNGAQPPVLSEPAPSVTEHTTRALEPVYNERPK